MRDAGPVELGELIDPVIGATGAADGSSSLCTEDRATTIHHKRLS